MWVINICISLTLGTITYQDLTSRSVYWYLFPLLACLGCYYHFNRSGSTTVTLLFIGLNLIIISSVLLCVWIYSRIKLKRKLEDTFGLGDILFFIAMALCLPTPSFIITFCFSLILSLTLHLVFTKEKTVPLAGFMSIHYMSVYLIDLMGVYPHIFY